jgi:hypothetical protein
MQQEIPLLAYMKFNAFLYVIAQWVVCKVSRLWKHLFNRSKSQWLGQLQLLKFAIAAQEQLLNSGNTTAMLVPRQ